MTQGKKSPLDEAVESYSPDIKDPEGKWVCISHRARAHFKAGARWGAERGYYRGI